jgi:hypothetical protein
MYDLEPECGVRERDQSGVRSRILSLPGLIVTGCRLYADE